MDRLEKLKNLFVMAAADGNLSQEEVGFLADRSKRWGLTDDQFTAAIQYAMSPEATLSIPQDKRDRKDMLRDLVRIMAADGELADIEKQLFAIAAAEMDISDEELNELFDSLLQ